MQVRAHKILTIIYNTQFQLIKKKRRKKRKGNQDREGEKKGIENDRVGSDGTYVVSEPL